MKLDKLIIPVALTVVTILVLISATSDIRRLRKWQKVEPLSIHTYELGNITNAVNISTKKSADYVLGVNDALDFITLLNLEQRMYATNRTWGEMGRIVAQRLNVERTGQTF